MPLTAEQETELGALRAKAGGVATGLSAEQSSELQALRSKQDGAVASQARDSQKIDQLFEQLRGSLPQQFRKRTDLPLSAEIRLAEPQRQKAFNELQRLGFTPRQIELSLQTKRAIDRPRIGRPAGGVGGAIAATALAGRLIPGPIDDVAIMIALIASTGAGLGGVAGEAVQTGIEEKRLISKGEALGAFATESLTELGTRGAVAGTKFLFSPLIKRTVPEAAALVDDFAKVGGNFSPTELDSRFSLQIQEAFSRGSFGAKQIFQEFEEAQGRAALAFADNIIDNVVKGVARQAPEEIGEVFAEGITRPSGKVFNLLDDLFNPLFKQVDDLAREGAEAGFRQVRAGGPAVRGVSGRFVPARELQRIRLTPTVSTKSLKAFAQRNLATDTRLNGQFLSPIGRSKLKKIVDGADALSFSDMRLLRSSFLKDARKLARDVDQSQGIIKQLARLTDEAIFDPKAARGLNPKARNLLENINALYKASQRGLETTFSEKLAKRLLKNPSNVVKELFPNNNPKSIRLLRQSLVEPISGKPSAEGKILWGQLRQAWLADVVDQATKEGVVKPKVFDNLLRKMGKEGLREIFPEEKSLVGVKRIQSLFDIAGKAPPSGTSLFSRSAQIGGLALMYKSGKEGDFIGFTAGSVLAIGPLAFAKLATSPRGVKFLTAGFKMKPGASGLVPNAVRMIRLLREINKREQSATLKQEQKKRRSVQQRIQLQKKTFPSPFGFSQGNLTGP